MMRPFRFAVQGGPFDDPAALAGYARLVESLGYDELFTYDHVGQAPGSSGGAKIDPFLPLVVAAGATERLRFGPLVLNNEFHQPVLLARTAATFDRITDGRLVLGLGTGYAHQEHDWIGSPIRPVGPRVTRFGESLAILRALLDTGAVDLDGEHESVHVPELGIRPLQDHVPFLIGGHGRRVVGLAGRFADVFQFTGLTHADDGTPSGGGFALEHVLDRGRWLSESAGDRDSQIERSVLTQFTSVGAGAPSVSKLAERFRLPEDDVVATPFALFGSLDQIVDKLERLREQLGISHVVIRDPEGFAPVVDALAGR